MNQPPHEILGLPANASVEEIKRAYRQRAKELHPDRGGDPRAFVVMQAAYETLLERRKQGKLDVDEEPHPYAGYAHPGWTTTESRRSSPESFDSEAWRTSHDLNNDLQDALDELLRGRSTSKRTSDDRQPARSFRVTNTSRAVILTVGGALLAALRVAIALPASKRVILIAGEHFLFYSFIYFAAGALVSFAAEDANPDTSARTYRYTVLAMILVTVFAGPLPFFR